MLILINFQLNTSDKVQNYGLIVLTFCFYEIVPYLYNSFAIASVIIVFYIVLPVCVCVCVMKPVIRMFLSQPKEAA